MRRVVRFRQARRGATAIEYAVLAGLVILAVATAIMLAGRWTTRSYDRDLSADVVSPQQQVLTADDG